MQDSYLYGLVLQCVFTLSTLTVTFVRNIFVHSCRNTLRGSVRKVEEASPDHVTADLPPPPPPPHCCCTTVLLSPPRVPAAAGVSRTMASFARQLRRGFSSSASRRVVIQRVTVVGGGQMGAGIAQVSDQTLPPSGFTCSS